jgi:hypothetical protein
MSKLDELKAKDYEETTALEDCILEVAKHGEAGTSSLNHSA